MMARRLRLGTWLPPTLLLLGLGVAWQLWVEIRDTPPYVLPSPTRIASAFVDSRHLLGPHLVTTLGETAWGLVIGAGVGAGLALLIGSLPLARRVLYPLLVAVQTVPMIVLAPLLALWFGFGVAPKVVVVALIVLFPVAVSTATAVTEADTDLVDLVVGMGGTRLDVLRTVRLPAAIPGFFSGLRIAAAYAVAGAVVGEWVGASRGLGIFITRSQASFRVDRVFVAVLLVAAASAALFGAVHLLARAASPWMYLEPTDGDA